MSFENINLPDDFSILHFDELDSTNLKAKEIAENESFCDKMIILADKQLAGRGRYDRKWLSCDGNLYFSLILKDDCLDSKTSSQISFIAALAAGKSVADFAENITLKWPNDILISDKKTGGILIEAVGQSNKFDAMIVGIGINIKNYPKNVIFPATSISENSDKISNRNILLEKIIKNFDNYYNIWKNNGFSEIREQWHKMSFEIGKKISSKTHNETLEGIYKGISKNGELLLELDNNEIRSITAGDVFFG